MKLTIATSYFPVSADIKRNRDFVLKQMRQAAAQGVDVIHFPEACLSGYAGRDMPSFDRFDWAALLGATEQILGEAKALKLWIILGSAHRLTGKHKPHNCLYIVSDRGAVVDRYDKRFCAGPKSGDDGDLAHYSSGSHFTVFDIKGVRCGALICHDYRYPELYREYKSLGVALMFHAYHAGNIPAAEWRALERDVGAPRHRYNGATTLPGITMPATMQSQAANNFMWISCANSSARQSCWGAFMVRPDGVIAERLRRNVTGLLISKIDTAAPLYDSTVAWRKRSIAGRYHSGTLVKDKRSIQRKTL